MDTTSIMQIRINGLETSLSVARGVQKLMLLYRRHGRGIGKGRETAASVGLK